MPRISLITMLIISVLTNLSAQRKKDKFPTATSASERWEGYQKRKKLIDQSWIKNIPFRNVGPTIMSGRVADLEVNPADPTHFYVAYASGGLWETKNAGASFQPLFDHQIVMTIGDITVDWENDIIYVGTGEDISSRSSYSGYGLYKSEDHGKTWQHLGLEESHHISRVILHPEDSKTLWVAVLGHLYTTNKQRGIFKSTDGGQSWTKVLYVNDNTGVVDLVINPANPNELMAASWERSRKAWDFVESGAGSAIYRSQDGGVTWENLSALNAGFPDTDGIGRIGLAYAPSSPNIVYAVVDNQDRRKIEKEDHPVTKELLKTISTEAFLALANDELNKFLDRNRFPEEYNAEDLKKEMKAGTRKPSDLVLYLDDSMSPHHESEVKGAEVYRSDDGGNSWKKTHEDYIDALIFSYGYVFGQIRVDHKNPELVYTMGVPLIKSKDGGKTWEATTMDNVHVDHHRLWLNPNRSGHLINGNDGGVNISYDDGETWVKCNSAPVAMFYTVNVDMDEPYNVYGGLQDNGTWKGPSTYTFSNSWHADGEYPYKKISGGDGMQVAIDTRDNETVYAGYQFGHYYRINTTIGERKYITPKHKLGEAPLRWNWQSPIILSSHNQDIVYFGSNKFHRSMDQGDSFETLSGDLTNGGRFGDVNYGTLTTISESPLTFGVIYVGSDDGLIHVSKDAGQRWEKVTNGLPANYWISRVAASHHQEGRVYASLNGYRWDHFQALIYKSDDYGATWTRIGLDLPLEPVNVIKEDPVHEDVLYVGTDHGVYASIDRGQSFMAFHEGLAAAPVHDLVIQARENDLVLGTHGRSIYIADVSTLQKLPDLQDNLVVFQPTAKQYAENWGTKGRWHWDGFEEPEVTLEVFSKSAGEAQIDILYDSVNLKSWKAPLVQGLNYISYDLTINGQRVKKYANKLKVEGDELEKKENGSYYLREGNYTVRATMDGEQSIAILEIKASKPKKARKGSGE